MSYLDHVDERAPFETNVPPGPDLLVRQLPQIRAKEPSGSPKQGRRAEKRTWHFSGLLAVGAAAMFARLTWGGLRKRKAVRKTVLAVGAHPDDVELGCGAALLRYRAAGYEVRAIVLSSGENGMRERQGRSPSRRRREAMRAGARLHLHSLRVLDFPDTRLFARREQIKRVIEEEILHAQPDIIFTHCFSDLHFDHRMVHSATIEASRHVPTVLCYENPNTPASFRPNVFIDVSPYLGRKIAALKCHASQARKSYFRPELIRSIARMRGNQAHVRFAEGFEAVRVRSGAM